MTDEERIKLIERGWAYDHEVVPDDMAFILALALKGVAAKAKECRPPVQPGISQQTSGGGLVS